MLVLLLLLVLLVRKRRRPPPAMESARLHQATNPAFAPSSQQQQSHRSSVQVTGNNHIVYDIPMASEGAGGGVGAGVGEKNMRPIVYATPVEENPYDGYEPPSSSRTGEAASGDEYSEAQSYYVGAGGGAGASAGEVVYAHGSEQGYGTPLTSVYGAVGAAGTEEVEGYGTPLTSVYGAVGAAYTEA